MMLYKYGIYLRNYLIEKITMAEINTSINERRKAGVSRPKKHTPKIDMTPMVDLGFLLIRQELD